MLTSSSSNNDCGATKKKTFGGSCVTIALIGGMPLSDQQAVSVQRAAAATSHGQLQCSCAAAERCAIYTAPQPSPDDIVNRH